MKRGERVIVIAFGKKELERVVWEDAGPGILVCTEGSFERALKTGDEPVCVGFPSSDVRRKPMGVESKVTGKRRAS